MHAFEDQLFDEAVLRAAGFYGCHPYLTEDAYRRELASGRIRAEDLSAVLVEDLGEDADFLIGFMGTRYHLRLAMLEHPLRLGTDAELRWLVAETDALTRFLPEAPPDVRQRVVQQTRHWIQRTCFGPDSDVQPPDRGGLTSLLKEFGAGNLEQWSERTWETFALHWLWRVCHTGVHGVKRHPDRSPAPIRHRDLLLRATGRDADLLVHEVLIRFCAAFLDQGLATWTLPGRNAGFLRAFVGLYKDARPVEPWLANLPAALREIDAHGIDATRIIDESLVALGVHGNERAAFIEQSLIALRGWSGMLWQMESNAEWTAHPAPAGTLNEFLAVRLLLDRLAIDHVARDSLPALDAGHDLRAALRHLIPHEQRVSVEQRAYLVFQLAQVRGWSAVDLQRLSKAEWSRLVEEIESFGSLERRRVYHLAYERRYRIQALDALLAHDRKREPGGGTLARPSFQAVCCIDEREESFRRHLEELDPACETYGVAGFFGAVMYYRGIADARYRPLCPVNLKPDHYVVEEPTFTFEEAGRIQATLRHYLGRLSHRLHVGTRSLVGGAITGMLGSIASIPLVMRVLLPRSTAQLRGMLGHMVVPPVTQLRLERTATEPGPQDDQLGFTIGEMARIVGGVLRMIGLTDRFAPLVVIAGHGSSSLNNPQAAAYDCGACGGARGGPNARAFAQMANHPRVRAILANSGLAIPDDVHFVGAYHNTCSERILYFDLDRLPASHRGLLERTRATLDRARLRNAHERCRRFGSAELTITGEEALRHVEVRAEDLSQTRPEYGHATNAMCFVGRRARTRGLFMDRRSFLTSYDPTQDDEDATILGGLLRAVVPVCAGINLEYFFSRVDQNGYGCGTKVPHNISALLGIMDGAASDLRTGLSQQMVELHEPMRILFVVDSQPERLARVFARESYVAQLVKLGWVQFAAIDPGSSRISLCTNKGFVPYEPEVMELPVVPSSVAWYRGWRDHLRFASIDPERVTPAASQSRATP